LVATDPKGYAACAAAVRDLDTRSLLPRIKIPVLIISGDHDVSTPWAGHGDAIAAAIHDTKRKLLSFLIQAKEKGARICGYGAPGKGNTLLNYCGIGTSLVPYIVDKNPLKVGKYTPGMHIPVLPVSTLLERQPDFVSILAWNFADEIISQQHEYHSRGGRFIVPVPRPVVI